MQLIDYPETELRTYFNQLPYPRAVLTDDENQWFPWFLAGFKDHSVAVFVGDEARNALFKTKYLGTNLQTPTAVQSKACYIDGWVLSELLQNKVPTGYRNMFDVSKPITQIIKLKTGAFFPAATRPDCIAEFERICELAKYDVSEDLKSDMSHWFEQGFCASDTFSLSDKIEPTFYVLMSELSSRVVPASLVHLQISEKYTRDARGWYTRGWRSFTSKNSGVEPLDVHLRLLTYGVLSNRRLEIRKKLGWVEFSSSSLAPILSVISKDPGKFRLG